MTSSKSFRASMLPSSLSILRSNSDSEATKTTTTTGESRQHHHKKLWHKSSTLDLSQLRSPNPPLESPRNESSPDLVSPTNRNGVPVPPSSPSRPQARKTKTWGGRFSSSLLSLISSPTDSDSPAHNHNKPLAPSHPPPPPPPSVPAPAPPSSHSPTETEPETISTSSQSLRSLEPSIRMAQISEDSSGIIVESDARDGARYSPPSPGTTAFLDSPVPNMTLGALSNDSNPQIMAPIPPSPEIPRAVMAEQEAAGQSSPERPSSSQAQDAPKVGKLRKQNPSVKTRSDSPQNSGTETPVSDTQARQTPPIAEPRGRRSISAQIPASQSARSSINNGRVTSTSLTPRPRSSQGESPNRGRVRRSWLPGGFRSRSNSVDVKNQTTAAAWVMSDDGSQAEYNPSLLKNGEKVPELWNEVGTVYVYLYPRGSGTGPSFKVPEFTVSSSYIFNDLIQSDLDESTGRSRARSFGGRDSLSVDDASRLFSPPTSPPPEFSSGDLRLYLPAAAPAGNGQLSAPNQSGTDQELERLIAIRNLFAFLTGQPLVGTKAKPTIFKAFLEIAALLQEFGFVSMDGTTFGDAVDMSFSFYMDQLGLADCRSSREKTLEALILGERMRYLDLYNEAFAHAAGKYSAIMDLRLPLWEQVSAQSRQALERAHLDLVNRQHSVNDHLESFEFPAVFAGIANSTSLPELRQVRFKSWRGSFSKMRNFVLNYYKTTFGNWPPKASSKKNPFAESGLNRLVLKMLYSDLCALYDLLVDRTNLTSRVMDEVPPVSGAADNKMAALSGLRVVMSEFDRSKPPVLPPIPYDCPQLPSPVSVLETYDKLSTREQAKFDKKIKEHELILILNKAYNYDTNSLKMPFLDQFKEFELREARGKTAQDMLDQRLGYWLFLYVVIQSLPMLVVDAPDMNFTEGVEYFLCEPPMGNPPWVDDRQVKKMWYEVAGGGGLVELSTDAVLFSVEATYHRSHCWLAAKAWESNGGFDAPPPMEDALAPLEPPRPGFSGSDFMNSPPPIGGPSTPSPPLGGPQMALRPRTNSPAGNRASQAWRSSIALGLEPVPLEPPNMGMFSSSNRSSSLNGRPLSTYVGSRSASMNNLASMNSPDYQTEPSPSEANQGATFDDILGASQKKAAKKKGRFF